MPYDAPKTPLHLRLNGEDDVVIALREIAAGTRLEGEGVSAAEAIPPGHKVATRAKQPGEPVRRYGQIIGFASVAIAPGQHVHTHNLEMRDFARDYAFGQDVRALEPVVEPATFMGIVRGDGRVATRNYIGVISTVNCSASVSKWVADAFRGDTLRAYPNIDGIVPLTHQTGCGMASTGEGIDVLRRTIAGYARHPNFGGVLVIGLGCEANQMDALFFSEKLTEADLLKPLIIQQQGGTAKTVAAGIEAVKKMLPLANAVKRERVPASHITVGLQCGGSDGYSGITANPALGAAADVLARHGGTAILSETPEVYGAEHLLTRRAVSRAVGEKLIARIKWWEEYTARNGGDMNNNPSPGNKAGGLTTILEKSLGAAAKGGTTNLVDVYEYAAKVTAKGFVFMDTPGYDPCSITGQVAGGANMVVFTTGRGSVYGCKPAPSIKLATNSRVFQHMIDDMDVNCGTIVEGGATVAGKGTEIFEMILRVASGEKSKSEIYGFGADEFIPWQIGAVM